MGCPPPPTVVLCITDASRRLMPQLLSFYCFSFASATSVAFSRSQYSQYSLYSQYSQYSQVGTGYLPCMSCHPNRPMLQLLPTPTTTTALQGGALAGDGLWESSEARWLWRCSSLRVMEAGSARALLHCGFLLLTMWFTARTAPYPSSADFHCSTCDGRSKSGSPSSPLTLLEFLLTATSALPDVGPFHRLQK